MENNFGENWKERDGGCDLALNAILLADAAAGKDAASARINDKASSIPLTRAGLQPVLEDSQALDQVYKALGKSLRSFNPERHKLRFFRNLQSADGLFTDIVKRDEALEAPRSLSSQWETVKGEISSTKQLHDSFMDTAGKLYQGSPELIDKARAQCDDLEQAWLDADHVLQTLAIRKEFDWTARERISYLEEKLKQVAEEDGAKKAKMLESLIDLAGNSKDASLNSNLIKYLGQLRTIVEEMPTINVDKQSLNDAYWRACNGQDLELQKAYRELLIDIDSSARKF